MTSNDYKGNVQTEALYSGSQSDYNVKTTTTGKQGER